MLCVVNGQNSYRRAIETLANCGHGDGTKDVVLKEDASRVRTGPAPLIFALLRNALVTCLHAAGFDSITQGRRHLALNLHNAITCVCGLSE